MPNFKLQTVKIAMVLLFSFCCHGKQYIPYWIKQEPFLKNHQNLLSFSHLLRFFYTLLCSNYYKNLSKKVFVATYIPCQTIEVPKFEKIAQHTTNINAVLPRSLESCHMQKCIVQCTTCNRIHSILEFQVQHFLVQQQLDN